MAYLVVPHEVSATAATIWIGALDEPFAPGSDPPSLESGRTPSGRDLGTLGFSRWTHHLDYQRVTITGLQPGTPLTLQLLANGQPQANASLTTLPTQLPTLEEKPFTVLLASCFCKREDAEGAVGRTYGPATWLGRALT